MKWTIPGSFTCSSKHVFDFSRQGYLNLSTRAIKTKYMKPLFTARRAMIDSGFFSPLHELVIDQIILNRAERTSTMRMLDAGCGEGSHLQQIMELADASTVKLAGTGIDLAKEGIAMAAKHNPENIWCVADLANCPFADGRFDIILNLLSPSSYSEFRRLLVPGGIVIKVVPGPHYLKELRDWLGIAEPAGNKPGGKSLERFRAHFSTVDAVSLKYEVALDYCLLESLLRMTPLTWQVTDEHILQLLSSDRNLSSVTCDFIVLLGKYER